jgi:hypothetical protein
MRTYLFGCLFFLGFLSSTTLVAQDNLYDEHEKEALRRFLRQPSSEEGLLNVDILWRRQKLPVDTTHWETDEMWLILDNIHGLRWDTSSELRRLRLINTYNLDSDYYYATQLAGNLDLSGFEYLTEVFVFGNKLTSINFSHCRKLESLDCSGNLIQSLNVDSCSNLSRVSCKDNRLKSISLKGCSNLETIEVPNNQLKSLNFNEYGNLRSIDTSNNPELTELKVEDCANLANLNCSGGQLQLLELQGHERLGLLNCSNNRLTSLDLTGCVSLGDLTANDNQLTDLNIKDCILLIKIYCSNNQITSLDLGGKKIQVLSCSNNLLTSLNFQIDNPSHKGKDAPVYIYCQNNQLTDLAIKGRSDYMILDCSHNQLSSLSLNCSFADSRRNLIYCNDNQLSSLPAEQLLTFTEFTCYNNQLPFSAFSGINIYSPFLYAPQKPVSLSTAEFGMVDLSRYLFNDKTRFRWYKKNDPDTPLDDILGEDGLFVIPENYANDTLICKMTNNDYPYLRDNYSFQWKDYSFTGDARMTCEVVVTHTGTVNVIEPKPYTRLYSADGCLYIETEKPSELLIYTLSGQLYTKQNVPPGKTVIPLPKGFYIASLDGQSEKVKL